MLKWKPVRGLGLYLKGGGRFLLNFEQKTSGELEQPNLPDGQVPTLFPAGSAGLQKSTVIMESGIGYQYVGRNGRFSYLELSVGRVLGDAIRYAGANDPIGRVNYLDTADLLMVNFTAGYRFGR